MSVKNYKCKILSTFLAVMTVLSFNNPSCAMEEVLPKWKSLSGQEREKFELYQFFRGNIEDKRDINFDGKFFKQGKLSRNLNVLVIVESEGSSDEVMGKLYNNVKKLSVDSQPYKCADGELHSAVNDDKLQFIKYSVSNLFDQIKSNKEFITELIDNTDLIFYVFNKDTDLINYDTFKKCYDAVNRLWCEKCGVDYPGYSHVESEGKRILWHQEAMKKRPCYSSFHYYWVTILDSSVDFEYMFNKFCNTKYPELTILSQYIKENRTDDVTYSEGKTVIKNWEEISYYIKLGYDRGEIANKVNCNEATVKRVADKYNLRIRKRTETLIEQYDLEDNLCNTYYSYNDAARFIIENNLDPIHFNIGIISDIIRSSMTKGKSYCEFIWKTKVLPDINTIEYNKDLYDNPS